MIDSPSMTGCTVSSTSQPRRADSQADRSTGVRQTKSAMRRAAAFTSANDVVPGTRKAERENVQVGDGARLVAIGLQHRVLCNGEVPVHVKVSLDEGNARIHTTSVT